jgi:hypothetical protein
MDETQNNTQTAPQPTQPPELTVTDLANLRSLVDVAVKRGTFTASEISAVGNVYDKLSAFLTAITAQQQSQQETK